MDYYTSDYISNSTIITLLPVRNDILIMRFFAIAQNDANPRVVDYDVALYNKLYIMEYNSPRNDMIFLLFLTHTVIAFAKKVD